MTPLLIGCLTLIASLLTLVVAGIFIGPRALPEPQRRRAALAVVAVLAIAGSVALPLSGGVGSEGILALSVLWLWLVYEGYREWRRTVADIREPMPPSAAGSHGERSSADGGDGGEER